MGWDLCRTYDPVEGHDCYLTEGHDGQHRCGCVECHDARLWDEQLPAQWSGLEPPEVAKVDADPP